MQTFVTTQWTQVLASQGKTEEARAALSELCETYYDPVIAFLRVRTGNADRARDLAHSFFEQLLRSEGLKGADPRRGRFRSYLLGAVKHFVSDQFKKESAERRGGSHVHVAIDSGTDTSPGLELPDSRSDAVDLEFDRQWAFTLLDRALTRLQTEQKQAGKEEMFDQLKPWLSGGSSLSQAELAQRLGMNEGAVKVAIHRLRRRFRELIKSEIAQTVNEQGEVQEEMNYLLQVLSR